MKTKTVKLALYKNIQFGFEGVFAGDVEGYVRISPNIDVEFEVIDDKSVNDAIKAEAVKAAKAKIEAAQIVLGELL